MYKTGGDVLAHYARTEMTPYALTGSDLAMSCRGGTVITPVLGSLTALHANTGKLAVFTWSMSALCAEQQALEQELRFYRAARAGNDTEALDARTLQKRFSRLAARRYYQSYLSMLEEYGDPVEGQCPALRRDFDELVYMVGTLGGVQALMHDTVADFTVGVPRDVAGRAERASACLDSGRWWGLPDGIRAAIWTALPMLAPPGADPWAELARVIKEGDRAGIRLNRAIYVMAAYSAGDQDLLRRAIKEFAAREDRVNADYALLDAMAELMVRNMSDRLWTEAVGRRTPHDGLGRFWDERADRRPVSDIEDLL